MSTSFLQPFLYAFFLSLSLALVLVLTSFWHGRFTFDTVVGIQKVHHTLVPRVGGLAIFIGFWAAKNMVPHSALDILESSLAVGIIAFSFGLLEDLTKRVSVTIRLWATLVPGVVGYFLTGYSLKYFGFEPLDFLLEWSVISVAFTAFAVCGVTHAVNMIDGFNGLAGWSAIWILGGLTLLALQAGDSHLALVSILLMASTLGFLLVNWPWGKIFLGDGGSYFLGVSIGWLCVVIVNQNPQISPFACLLLCAYPITEAIYSIYRRMQSRLSTGQPDRLHLHQLIATTLVYPYFCGKIAPLYKNSLTGFLVSLLSLPAIILAVLFNRQQSILIVCFFINAAVYTVIYRSISNLTKIRDHIDPQITTPRNPI